MSDVKLQQLVTALGEKRKDEMKQASLFIHHSSLILITLGLDFYWLHLEWR